MTSSLPTEINFALIDQTATQLRRCPSEVQATIDQLDYSIESVLDAMNVLGTCDPDTLAAFLTGETVLDDSLDGWLLEVG